MRAHRSRRLGLGPTMKWRMALSMLFLIGTQTTYAADTATIQRGAAFFKDYCAGCHSLRYMRPELKISMPEVDARQWFGRMPPDLSLTARVRGPAWIYTYLTSFYAEKSRPFGTNNRLIPGVAMPNVLAPLTEQPQLEGDLHDVVSFLVYVAEPTRLIRYWIGFVVMVFLVMLGVLIYRIKRMCWRDIC